jgi:hypothetical protein
MAGSFSAGAALGVRFRGVAPVRVAPVRAGGRAMANLSYQNFIFACRRRRAVAEEEFSFTGSRIQAGGRAWARHTPLRAGRR